jgi:hypothetical protein
MGGGAAAAGAGGGGGAAVGSNVCVLFALRTTTYPSCRRGGFWKNRVGMHSVEIKT